MLALLLAAAACSLPAEPISHDIWAANGRLILREGACVIDPGFWLNHGPPARLKQPIAV